MPTAGCCSSVSITLVIALVTCLLWWLSGSNHWATVHTACMAIRLRSLEFKSQPLRLVDLSGLTSTYSEINTLGTVLLNLTAIRTGFNGMQTSNASQWWDKRWSQLHKSYTRRPSSLNDRHKALQSAFLPHAHTMYTAPTDSTMAGAMHHLHLYTLQSLPKPAGKCNGPQ